MSPKLVEVMSRSCESSFLHGRTTNTYTYTDTRNKLLFYCPCSLQRQRVANINSGECLVDNPIYKTCTSTTSLINTENGLRHDSVKGTSRLRAVGSECNHHTPTTTRHSTLVTEAENPQYGTHLQQLPPNQTPPPSQKAPQYTKVNVAGVVEPTYELIHGGNGVAVKIPREPPPPGEDPVYSIPNPVKQEPLYESTMDIPAITGKDGDYAKLNYDKS